MKRIFIAIIVLCMSIAIVPAQENHWMPDAHLRTAIREEIGLPDAAPLTKEHIKLLWHLEAQHKEIHSIQGLEFAQNLEDLNLGVNLVEDISPLRNLTKLRGLSLFGNQVSDISPLANLTRLGYFNGAGNPISDLRPLSNLLQLEELDLWGCQISDVTPLAGLKNLKTLILGNNLITDVSPLANLSQLEVLTIVNNSLLDFSVLEHLNLTIFERDMICEMPSLPVEERILTRSFPSVLIAWDRFIIPGVSEDEATAYHDLFFSSTFMLRWQVTLGITRGMSTHIAGNLEKAQAIRDKYLALNPNMVFLVEVRIHNHSSLSAFPPNSDFLLRDDKGQNVYNQAGEIMMNLMNLRLQDLLIERIVAIAECGLFDGIMIDGFNENATSFVGRHHYPHTDEEIIAATTRILRGVRDRVREDFLILVNANRSKPTAYAEYVNGTFMETGLDTTEGYEEYSHQELNQFEDTLLWAEENLRAPQINCLEGWGNGTQPPDSPTNQRGMRAITTLGLTHSDGYVLYNTGQGFYGGEDHEHIWYDFWDADLGKPIEEKAKLYENREGLFIREFTNGWVVYNRSGKEQHIKLPEKVSGVANGTTGTQHTLPDLDGEIYLKSTGEIADLNSDGIVNILDLVIVANALGEETPDLNGDGVVNILDLVIVANAFSG